MVKAMQTFKYMLLFTESVFACFHESLVNESQIQHRKNGLNFLTMKIYGIIPVLKMYNHRHQQA